MNLRPPPPWLARKIAKAPMLRYCILCAGQKVHAIGIFVPLEPWRFYPLPPAAGKKRLLLYSLCGRCFEREDKTEAVEAEFLLRMEALR